MKTILIVDDEPALRNLLVLHVTAGGYRALEAATGAEAIRLVNAFPEEIHLAIIDQTLEDRKGSDVGAELIAIRPGTRILLISGAPRGEVSSDPANNAPIPSFLQKPFSRQELLDTIRDVLRRQGAESAGRS